MNRSSVSYLIVATSLAIACSISLSGQVQHDTAKDPPPTVSQANEHFRPYEFLIGEWDVKSTDDGAAAAIVRIRWGPNRSYIWYATNLLLDGHEQPHLEGMLVWNGVHKNLDMLFSMDLRSGRVQEQGTMSVDIDGTIVRDITAVYGEGSHAMGMPPIGPEGATIRFRETYKKAGSDKILTSAMRESADGWVATFPGSDHLIMTRRPR